ncbi:MAG TPA: low specificity L-threonine aldolase [Chthoniobacterales bacterium]|nr:low specificity L-threonine aldolase [Chthoniobacterales bacterium]
MMQPRRREEFASDNTAGICPEALAQLEAANSGSAAAYGDDGLTSRVRDQVREIFETNCDVYLVFNGTAANALVLAQLCRPFHSVICHQFAHIQTDECGAPEFFSGGSKLLPVDGDQGKVSLKRIEAVLAEQTGHGVHAHKPRVISITQATELGTVYSRPEIEAICELARNNSLLVHMDGARFANALAFLDCSPADITWKAGVDVLCFGGTKNGIGSGELVIFFKPELADDFDYRVKQAGQLGSKMRFLAAGWSGLLTNDVWLRNARHANNAAQRLAEKLATESGFQTRWPVQSNSLFLRLSDPAAAALTDQGWMFYKFVEPDIYRLMCSWATTDSQIDEFVRHFRDAVAR